MVAADKVFYYAVAPVLSFPVFFMILWDWPRDRPILYQIWVSLSTWQWGLYNLIFMCVGSVTLPPTDSEFIIFEAICVDTMTKHIRDSPAVAKTSSRCSSQFHFICLGIGWMNGSY